ncbi:MAG: TlpA disulfide reductase family protein [Bryobacterales bacterium]|nr:TlpA disulfide reductase family protein [Bryobacterales bacterium]
MNKLLQAGGRAPSLRLLEEVLAGGPALLAFFKVSCPVCQFTFPFLERIASGGSLRVFGVSQDDAKATARFAKEFGVTFPMLLDQEPAGYAASNAFGVSTVPTLFMVDAGGEVAFSGEGFVKRDLADLGRRAGVEVFRQDEPVPEWKAG